MGDSEESGEVTREFLEGSYLLPVPSLRDWLLSVGSYPALEARGYYIPLLLGSVAYSTAAEASSARLETMRSGLASAAFTAPTPGRAEGRFTHTVARPRACAGITSW